MKKLFLAGATGDIGTAVKQKFQQYNYLITDQSVRNWI